MKIIVWLALIVLVVLAIRKNIRTPRNYQSQQFSHQMKDSSEPINKPSEVMVCCAKCQVYIPESEAIVSDGMTYCSVEHVPRDV